MLHSFLESKQQERQRQPLFFLHSPGQSVQLERGEFLCPLCQSPCNTVLPLLMPRPPAMPPKRPANNMDLEKWLQLMQMATDLAEGDPMDTGKCMCKACHKSLTFEISDHFIKISFHFH